MTASFAGVTIFNVGLAWSCCPRPAIRSEIFCGRGITLKVCVGGGVTLLVAVVPVLSEVVEHAANNTTIIMSTTDDKIIFRYWPILFPPGKLMRTTVEFSLSVL